MDNEACDAACAFDSSPPWAKGLKRSGMYYEGIVDLDKTLEAHRRITMTTYGTRTSKKQTTFIESNKENENIQVNINIHIQI